MATFHQGSPRSSQTPGFELILKFPAPSHSGGGAPLESTYALRLKRGFPRLKFDDATLERNFWRVQLAKSRTQIRPKLLLGIGFVIGFSALTHLVLPGAINDCWT